MMMFESDSDTTGERSDFRNGLDDNDCKTDRIPSFQDFIRENMDHDGSLTMTRLDLNVNEVHYGVMHNMEDSP